MDTAYLVIAVVLALALVGLAVGKLTRNDAVAKTLSAAGVSDAMYVPLALVELLGAAGLVIGIWVPWLGVAAAVGVVAYFAGAVLFHVRAKDPGVMPPIALGLLGVAALATRLLSR